MGKRIDNIEIGMFLAGQNVAKLTQCEFCSKKFYQYIQGKHAKYCSHSCRLKAYRERKKKKEVACLDQGGGFEQC